MRLRYLVAPFPGVLLPGVVVGIVVWTLQGGASRQYSVGQALRGWGLPALTKEPKPDTGSPAKPNSEVKANKLAEAYGTLPLSFEANRGQADRNVKFLCRGRGGTWFLTSTEAVLSLSDAVAEHGARNREQDPAVHAGRSAGRQAATVVRMRLMGANPAAEVSGVDRLPGDANYLIGSEPQRWHTRVPTFAKVQYKNVYPGINLVYYGNQQQLEYDFVVAPGADPKAIRLAIETGNSELENRNSKLGAGQSEIQNRKSKIRVDASGDLVLQAGRREIRFRKPRIHQEAGGEKQDVSGGYVLQGPRQVGFEVGSYDASRPLTIDPVLSYSTYLGGLHFDQANGIAVDALGNAYVAGFTSSANFPTTAGAFDTTYGTGFDAFVTKFSLTGSLVYSTYLGGTSTDQALAVAVDTLGDAYVTGQTFSSNFPTTAGAFKTTYGGRGDAFVSRLNASGSSLVYSSYLGGSGLDEARGIAVDLASNAYVTGKTFSTNFPISGALQASNKGNEDAFVTQLNASGSLVFSTYLGGSGFDRANGIAVDLLGNVHVTGYTNSSDFPVSSAFQGACRSCPKFNDAFVAEIGPHGSAFVYSTYLGGSADDEGASIAVDPLGNTYVTGFSYSTDFPTTSGAFQRSLLGGSSAFVTKISPNGSSFAYSTYLGSDKTTYGQGIAVLGGIAYVTGVTTADHFPLANPMQSTRAGLPDAFLTELNATGVSLLFSTFFGSYAGGTSYDEANAVAVDALGNAYITGETRSTTFPVFNAFQSTYAGGDADAFITKIAFPTGILGLSPL